MLKIILKENVKIKTEKWRGVGVMGVQRRKSGCQDYSTASTAG